MNRTSITSAGVAALQKALPNCKIEWSAAAKPIATRDDPAFQQWMNEVATLPAEQQVDAVAKKLRELNPGFDGTVTFAQTGMALPRSKTMWSRNLGLPPTA